MNLVPGSKLDVICQVMAVIIVPIYSAHAAFRMVSIAFRNEY